jgi:hypothetical protein
MGWSQFDSVLDTSTVGIGIIPLSTRRIFFPILYSVTIKIASVLDSRRISFIEVNDTIEVRILLAIIELVTVSIVVSRVGSLRRITIGTVDFDTV